MPVDALALATLADLKTYLAITATTNDTTMCAMIDRASAEIEAAVGVRFVAFATTEYHDGDGASADLFLDYWPIVSVGTLYDDTKQTRDWASNTIVTSTYYRAYPKEGRIRRTDAAFSAGHRNVRVDLQAGFNTVPEDVQKECIRIAAIDWMNSPAGQGRLGQSSQAMPGGQGSVTFDANAAEVSAAIVKRWKRVSI